MVDCFQMVLEGLAADRNAFFQHQGGFAGGQRIALDCIGREGDVDPLAVLQTVNCPADRFRRAGCFFRNVAAEIMASLGFLQTAGSGKVSRFPTETSTKD